MKVDREAIYIITRVGLVSTMAYEQMRTAAIPEFKEDPTSKSVSSSSAGGASSTLWTHLRRLLVDLPLAFVFLCFLVVASCRNIHSTYFVPLYDRSERTFDQLHDELTYYHRECTAQDVSTDDLEADALLDSNEPTSVSVEKMMRHGTVIIPQVLTPETTKDLRQYIVDRSANLPKHEAFPMSQGERRLSYGIDVTEHPTVARAVQEVAQHDQTRKLMQSLLGDIDPANAEITIITAYPGAIDQVWHSDTKEEGNALKFARTYTHSYSLFLPLQNTTQKMGATDVCPGTHYCANFDLSKVCEDAKLPVSQADPEGIFRAGHGALINQIVWHRGSGHFDHDAEERIVFIVSFLARPKFDGKDARQLSRGTYFHQKWNMWGHTWKDMLDPMTSMGKPFSILRSIGLYKPSTRNWGYDLVTSVFQRFCNDQMEWEDLDDRFLPKLDQLKFPEWLRGKSNMGRGQRWGWQLFYTETLAKTYEFVRNVAVAVHGGYAVIVLGIAIGASICNKKGEAVLFTASKRLLVTHGIMLLCTLKLLRDVRNSKWGINALNGRLLRRPFAPKMDLFHSDEGRAVSRGPTTYPTKDDVLLGSRFDAPFLGSYDDWLRYHTGNDVFLEATSELAPFYRTYRGLDPVFGHSIEESVLQVVKERDGRFLQQDFRSSDWRLLSDEEVNLVIREELMVQSSEALSQVRKTLRYFVADWRFGLLRQTPMSRLSQLMLTQLERKLVESPIKQRNDNTRKASSKSTRRLLSNASTLQRPKVEKKRSRPSVPTKAEPAEFKVGSLVWAEIDALQWKWHPGVVDYYDEDSGTFSVSLEEGDYVDEIGPEYLRKRVPLVEGDRLTGCMEPVLNDCWEGRVDRVMADGDIMMAFDDGDYGEYCQKLGGPFCRIL